MNFPVIKTFSTPLNFRTQSVQTCFGGLSANSKYFSFIKDSELFLCSLRNISITPVMQNVEDYIWQEKEDSPEFLTISTRNKEIYICSLEVLNDIPSLNIKFLFSAQSILDEVEAIEEIKGLKLLRCTSSGLLLLLNSKVFALWNIQFNHLTLNWTAELPEDEGFAVSVQYSSFVFFALTSQKSIFAFSLHEGTKIALWDLKSCENLPKEIDVLQFCFSSCMNILVTYCSDRKIYLMKSIKRKEFVESQPAIEIFQILPLKTYETKSRACAFMKKLPSLVKPSFGQQAQEPSCWELISDIPDGTDCQLLLLSQKNVISFFGQEKCQGFQITDLESKQLLHMERFDKPGIIIYSTYSMKTQVPMLVFEDSIRAVLFGITNERLINEVMGLSGSSVAESLSQINSWQSIAIDISVLQQGLKNRQLDMISFFLKTKEEVFEVQLKKDFPDVPISVYIQRIEKETEDLNLAFSYLLEAFRENSRDVSSKHFSQQLLRITLSTLLHLLKKISSFHAEGIMELEQLKCQLQHCLMRVLLEARIGIRQQAPHSLTCGSHEDPMSSFEDSTLGTTSWNSANVEEIIRESVVSGDILMAQSFFLKKCEENKFDKKCIKLETFRNVGFQFALESLQVHNLDQACNIILNLGCVVHEKLKQILMCTHKQALRKYLQEELTKQDILSCEDTRILEFLTTVEIVYSSAEFVQHCDVLLAKRLPQVYPYSTLLTMLRFPVLNPSIEVVFRDLGKVQSGPTCYSQLVAEWLKSWDLEMLHKILAFGILHFSQIDKLLLENVSIPTVWSYLLEHGDLERLKFWIKSFHSHSNPSSHGLYSGEISDVMVNSVKGNCMKHIEKIVIAELARIGLLPEDAVEEFNDLLEIMGEIACLPIDVAESRFHFDIQEPKDFVHRLVHYCLQHELDSFLYNFCTSLSYDVSPWLCHLCNTPFMQCLSTFCQWIKKPEDQVSAFHAVLKLTQVILKLDEPTLDAVWSKGSPSLCLAIVLLSPLNLSHLGNPPADGALRADIGKVREVLKDHPLLREVAFKPDNVADHVAQDISLYQLLQNSAPFDPVHLFGWQKTNSIHCQETMTVMPHFSLPSLMEKYSLREDLNFVYYLYRGRPAFAFQKFVAQELCTQKIISLKRLKAASHHAMEIAFSHFTNSKIVSSCIAFLEFLGQDSLPLRVDISAALYVYRSKALLDKNSISQEDYITKILKLTRTEPESANRLLDLMCEGIKTQHSSCERLDRVFEKSLHLLHLFCYFHQLSVPCFILEICAKNNDWLKFLLWSHIYQFSKNEVYDMLKLFPNQVLAGHLQKALTVNVVAPEKKVITGRKDTEVRKSFIHKLLQEEASSPPLRTEQVSLKPPGTSKMQGMSGIITESFSKSPHSSDSRSVNSIESGAEEFLSIVQSSLLPEDLLELVLRCTSLTCPWELLLQASATYWSPTPCVLAACFTDAPLVSLFTWWLKTTVLSPAEIDTVYQEQTLSDLQLVLEKCVLKKRLRSLLLGYQIFQKESPLIPLIEFLILFLLQKEWESSLEKLKQFKEQLKKHSLSNSTKVNMMTVEWIERASMKLLTTSVLICQSNYEQKILLGHYASSNFSGYYSKVRVPHFLFLHQMVEFIEELDFTLPLEKLMNSSNEEFQLVVQSVISGLSEEHYYNEAIKISETAGISSGHVNINQLNFMCQKQKNAALSRNLTEWLKFWEKCDDILKKNNVEPQLSFEFFKGKLSGTYTHTENHCIMRKALLWLTTAHKIGFGSEEDLEKWKKDTWLLCIKAEVENLCDQEDTKPVHSFALDSLVEKEEYCMEELTENLTDPQEIAALEKIINRLLSQGNFHEACYLSKVFVHDTTDMLILLTCIQLAQENITVEEIDPRIKGMIGRWKYHRIRRTSFVGLSKSENSEEEVNQIAVLNLIEELRNMVSYSEILCSRVLVCYSIAMKLQRNYVEVALEQHPLLLLTDVLVSGIQERFSLAREIITVFYLSDDEVIIFLYKETLAAIEAFAGAQCHKAPRSSQELIFNPYDVTGSFQMLIHLCQDPASLGYKLLLAKNPSLTLDTLESDRNALAMEVELCIRAHDCFTEACCMQGISQVLHRCNILTQNLVPIEEFSLLIRLLTGIGRYSEMTYVFDVLKENHRFELLFQKGMEKVPHLRIALLDYLKNHVSSDSDMYTMLTLNFSMYREIAEILESSALESIKELIVKDDPETRKQLERVMQNLADAAESYVKADCLLHAQTCARKAELVALQIHLLSKNVNILHLDLSSLSEFISEHPFFFEAQIVAEAYQHQQSWGLALLKRVVLEGDWDYFGNFKTCYDLTTTHIEDIAKRYLLLANKSDNIKRNMQLLLEEINCIETKYRLASELAFPKLAVKILQGDGGMYLQDILNKTVQR